MKKIIIPFLLIIGLCASANAQLTAQENTKGDKISSSENSTLSRKELKGNKYAFTYSFVKAIDKYTRAKNLSVQGQRSLAECYRNIGQNVEAEAVYSKLIAANTEIISEDFYNYAMVLRINGKHDDAVKWMDKFAELKPEDLRAKSYKANKDKYFKLSADQGAYKVDHLTINTNDDDFGPSYFKNSIVFSSTNAKPKMIVRNSNWNGKPYWNMNISEVDGNQLKKSKNFDKKLNSKLHDGPASFSNNGTFMAFTRNNNKDKSKDKVVELQIQFSTLTDGKWSKPEPFILNSPDYSVGQPFLTSDGKTMYFTSDMPGGYGGSDLYKTSKSESGTWGKAENLGNKINTEGDELFPFFEETNEVLFFTSNGHYGLGGMDVFVCATNGSDIGTVANAGTPVNTKSDDLSAIVNSQMTKGYFSSNRPDGSGGDDIYYFDILKSFDIGKKIMGIAQDLSGNPIPGAFITLLDDKGVVIDTITTSDDAAYTFLVDSDKDFKLTGKKEKFIDGEKAVDTKGTDFIVKANVTLLTKKEIIHQQIVETADLGKILELNSIYFDLDKYDIRPDAEKELDKIIEIMNEYPNMVVELSSYTDCRESKAYNQKLSDNRAKASAEYVKKKITNPHRIYGKGYSETNLVNNCSCEGDAVSECTEAEHQKNRRTEFIIIKK